MSTFINEKQHSRSRFAGAEKIYLREFARLRLSFGENALFVGTDSFSRASILWFRDGAGFGVGD